MNIKELRTMAGFKQKQFAELFEIPVRTLQDWELGNARCPEYLRKLVAYKIFKEEFKMNEVMCERVERLEKAGVVIESYYSDCFNCTRYVASYNGLTFKLDKEYFVNNASSLGNIENFVFEKFAECIESGYTGDDFIVYKFDEHEMWYTKICDVFNRVGVHYGCFIDFVKFEKASDVAMTDKEKEDYEDSVDDGAAIFTREVKK